MRIFIAAMHSEANHIIIIDTALDAVADTMHEKIILVRAQLKG